jgi:hypothetical protein
MHDFNPWLKGIHSDCEKKLQTILSKSAYLQEGKVYWPPTFQNFFEKAVIFPNRTESNIRVVSFSISCPKEGSLVPGKVVDK